MMAHIIELSGELLIATFEYRRVYTHKYIYIYIHTYSITIARFGSYNTHIYIYRDRSISSFYDSITRGLLTINNGLSFYDSHS